MHSPSSDEPTTEREEVLSMLADTMHNLHDEIEAREPMSIDEEELHIKRIRTLGYLSGHYRKLMKDTDIDEMEDELALLQEATDVMEGQ